MSTYHTEGFIKTVSKGKDGIVFTIVTAPPYLFETKDNNKESSVKRKLLLVNKNVSVARIKDADVKFTSDDNDYMSLLIAKASHLKVRIAIESVKTLRVKVLDIL